MNRCVTLKSFKLTSSPIFTYESRIQKIDENNCPTRNQETPCKIRIKTTWGKRWMTGNNGISQWTYLHSLKQKSVSMHQKALNVTMVAIHFFSPDILRLPLGFHTYLWPPHCHDLWQVYIYIYIYIYVYIYIYIYISTELC